MKSSRFAQELVEEGRVEVRRADVLRALRTHLQVEPPADLASELGEENGLERLEPLLDLAVTCANLAEFRAALAARQNS
jgi:hypothetical protein